MRKIYAALAGVVLGLACNVNAQTATLGSLTDSSIGPARPDSIVQLTAEAQGLQLVTPDLLPRGGTYWWVMPNGATVPTPCLPPNSPAPIYQIIGNSFLVDATDGQVAVRRRPGMVQSLTSSTVNAALESLAVSVVNLITEVRNPPALLAASPMTMNMMASSPATSYANDNRPYLSNLAANLASDGSMMMSFSISGSINFVPYDIFMTTNLMVSSDAWNWIGLGYTSNRYSFTSQPGAMALYRLAKPMKTMVVPWGDNFYGQCDIWNGITNAVQVTGGYEFSLALLNDGTVTAWGYNGATPSALVPAGLSGVKMIASGWQHNVALLTNGMITAWGDNFYGELNVPSGLSNVVAISANAVHSLALKTNGTVVAWGYNASGETSVPAGLTNVTAIAAGGEHSLAVSNGCVFAWGYNGYGQCSVPSNLSNVVDVAAGWIHSLALKRDGTVVAWGDNANGERNVPSGLSNVVAIVAGGDSDMSTSYSLALKSDGTIVAWGGGDVLNPVIGLSNVIALGSGSGHALAIRTGPRTPVITLAPKDKYQAAGGNVTFATDAVGLYGVSYQWQFNGVDITGATNDMLLLTNVQTANEGAYNVIVTDRAGMGSLISSNANLYIIEPPAITYQSQPTNIVCIYGNYVEFSATASAPGQYYGFPVKYYWQFNGTNINGITNSTYSFYASDANVGAYTFIASNIAGTVSATWQVVLTNTINVTNDLLLVYNTNSTDSATVLNYYLAHRPGVVGANVLGIGCTTNETIWPNEFTNSFISQIRNWLTVNPAIRPQYVILFNELPSRIYDGSGNTWPSVQYQIANIITNNWSPFVTSINMDGNGIANCIAYINKLQNIGSNYSLGNLVISASAGGYNNTNYVLDNVHVPGGNNGYVGAQNVSVATNGLLNAGVPSASIMYLTGIETNPPALPHLTNAVNVAGYMCWGVYTSLTWQYATNGLVRWSGNSGWWLIETIESYNGLFHSGQGNFVAWYSPNAFGGSNYENTPIGAVSHTDEPFLSGINNSSIYFGLWASGKNFAICAWKSRNTPYFQATGDPFVTR